MQETDEKNQLDQEKIVLLAELAHHRDTIQVLLRRCTALAATGDLKSAYGAWRSAFQQVDHLGNTLYEAQQAPKRAKCAAEGHVWTAASRHFVDRCKRCGVLR